MSNISPLDASQPFTTDLTPGNSQFVAIPPPRVRASRSFRTAQKNLRMCDLPQAEFRPAQMSRNEVGMLANVVQTVLGLVTVLLDLVKQLLPAPAAVHTPTTEPQPTTTPANGSEAGSEVSVAEPVDTEDLSIEEDEETDSSEPPQAADPENKATATAKVLTPHKTLDIKSYIKQTFGDQSTITEKEAYLAVVGWGFNVMSDFGKNDKIRQFFNRRKQEVINEQLAKGRKVDYRAVANAILRGAIKEKLITRFQAEHTKGNAFFAAQLDSKHDSLNSSLDSDKALTQIQERLTFLINNPDKNMFRPV